MKVNSITRLEMNAQTGISMFKRDDNLSCEQMAVTFSLIPDDGLNI